MTMSVSERLRVWMMKAVGASADDCSTSLLETGCLGSWGLFGNRDDRAGGWVLGGAPPSRRIRVPPGGRLPWTPLGAAPSGGSAAGVAAGLYPASRAARCDQPPSSGRPLGAEDSLAFSGGGNPRVKSLPLAAERCRPARRDGAACREMVALVGSSGSGEDHASQLLGCLDRPRKA
jgi:hypothetical protein